MRSTVAEVGTRFPAQVRRVYLDTVALRRFESPLVPTTVFKRNRMFRMDRPAHPAVGLRAEYEDSPEPAR